MKKAEGSYISFLDAGREISPKGIMMLMAHMDWYNADIVVGSKKHPARNGSVTLYHASEQLLSQGLLRRD